MMNLFNSYRANRNWVKAHSLMGGQFQGLALIAIRKAVELEPNAKKIPEYLELQGHIELSVGKNDLALKSFQRALNLIREKSAQFEDKKTVEMENSLLKAIREINEKTVT